MAFFSFPTKLWLENKNSELKLESTKAKNIKFSEKNSTLKSVEFLERLNKS